MLGLVGVKLLIEDIVKIGPVASLAGIAAAFTIGIGLSIRADRRDRTPRNTVANGPRAMHRGSDFAHEERETAAR